jgi:hypothetical protein
MSSSLGLVRSCATPASEMLTTDRYYWSITRPVSQEGLSSALEQLYEWVLIQKYQPNVENLGWNPLHNLRKGSDP